MTETTTIPLAPDQLKAFILRKDASAINRTPDYIVDYAGSQLKTEHFLSYISNMRLCVIAENIPPTDLKVMLKRYLNSNISTAVNNLSHIIASVLIYRKKPDTAEVASILALLEDGVDAFIADNIIAIESWEKFLSAIPYTAPYFFTFYKDTVGQSLIDSGEIEVIDDPKGVSPNVFNLLLVEDFIEIYLSLLDKYVPAYYRYCMTQRCFEGKNLVNVLKDYTSVMPFLYQFSAPKEGEPAAL